MLRIKKLDIFVLKSFLLLFAGTFFICLFIFMMQFLWRYVDELVGKGLEINVLAQFFFYSGLTLIPLSLPLAILLAALMTFGNFGERYELLSMKAAGIPLLRIMRPVVLFCAFLGAMSFFFQNEIGPRAQKQLWTLLVSMKQKSPEVDIPEGVFYSDIDGYNIYVKHKDRKTGMLKDVLIYNFSDGFENAHIIWAEEGKLELTADKQQRADSVGRAYFNDVISTTYKSPVLTRADSTKLEKLNVAYINTDSIYNSMTSQEKMQTLSKTENRVSSLASECDMKSFMSKEMDNSIRTHRSDWHKKITLSLACLIFFFIGAPLGAIIRKGGLGMPVVISVLIFVVYYIIDSGATRVGKSGEMNIVLGTWMSTLVLAPLGAFFTYKSNKDSVVFNIDTYAAFFRKVFGIRLSRHMFKKEVIIHTPEYRKDIEILKHISVECEEYLHTHRLKGLPNYIEIFTSNKHDDTIADISKQMETVIEELSNTKDHVLLNIMNNYPILWVKSHKSPFDNRWLNVLLGIVIPAGLLVYLNIWRFRLRLEKDLKVIIKTNEQIVQQIKDQHYYSQQ